MDAIGSGQRAWVKLSVLWAIDDKGNRSGDRAYGVHMNAGHTEFHGEPTRTCLAIGPAAEERIDTITGHLKLL